jgi:hypothetical protein
MTGARMPGSTLQTGAAFPAELKAAVAELWAVRPELSARLIGERLGLRKAQVVGIAFRMKLSRRPSPIVRRVVPVPVPAPAPEPVASTPRPVVRAPRPPRPVEPTALRMRPLLWSFDCPACARRLFREGCAARLEAMAA